MLPGERMVCGKGEDRYYKGESWGEVEGEVDMKKYNGTCVRKYHNETHYRTHSGNRYTPNRL